MTSTRVLPEVNEEALARWIADLAIHGDPWLLPLEPIRWEGGQGGEVREFLAHADDGSLADLIASRQGALTPRERRLVLAERNRRRRGLYPRSEFPL